MELLQDIQKGIMEVNSIRDKNRKHPDENHLATLVDGSDALFWVVQPGKPHDYIGEAINASRMWSNRILTQFKDKYGRTRSKKGLAGND